MTSPPRRRRYKLYGVPALLVGAVITVICVQPIARTFGAAFITPFSAPVQTTPYVEFVHLRHGKYQLLESTDSNQEVSAEAVQITEVSTGTLLSTRQSGGNTTVDRDGEQFVDVVKFSTNHAGEYKVVVGDYSQARMIIGGDPADLAGASATWAPRLAVGVLLVVLGIVLLLTPTGPGRRQPRYVYYGQPPPSRYQPLPPPYGQPPPAAGPMPGWYPDPTQPGGWRYWDGQRWLR